MTQVSIFDKSDRPFDAEGMERHIARALTVKAPSGLVENAWYQAIRRVFDPQLVAAGNIPARPCLFVGNHALFALDGMVLTPVMLHRQGRFLRALGDRFLWNSLTENRLLAQGAVIGDPAVCSALMEHDCDLLAFPGGAHEATKTASRQYTLQWKERYGFVRQAALHGYTIMPFAMVGPDEFYDHLIEGEDLPDTAVGKFLQRIGVLGEHTRSDMLPPIPIGALGSLFPKPQRCYIQFGQPLDLGRYTGRKLTLKRQQLIRAAVALQIETMLGELLERREREKERDGLLRRLLTR
ncbi:MAG: hypothetical protein KA739_12005 [Pseudomonadales bacterium]|nr:hypothetical protein [Pseudomonadales bacterium]MBP6228901.1 hypothetical protein [Pseudomonadales bacterium]